MQSKRSGSGAAPRRVKVAGKPNVYYRQTPAGRVYEIGYRDHAGKQRWRVVHGDLKTAETVRDELIGRRRRGEKIASTRATFAEVAAAWLEAQTTIRDSTRQRYESALRVHALPRLGRYRLAAISEDDISDLIRQLQRDGLAAWSIRAVLTPVSRVFSWAVRRGMVSGNPVQRLERGERPSVRARDLRILGSDELARLMDEADDATRALIAVAAFTGCRLGEMLALRWQDVDFEAGTLRVVAQLDRYSGARVEPKTHSGKREVALAPSLVRVLAEHRLRSPYSLDVDPVFCTAGGGMLDQSNIRRSFKRAASRAGLEGIRLHDLRHVAASALIRVGADPLYVSRQLGHADPAVTMRVYAGEFDKARHADRVRAAMEAEYGALMSPSGRGGVLER